MSNSTVKPETQGMSRARFFIGGTLFVVGFLCPLFVPLVTGSDLPGNWKATLTTALMVGLPEVGMLLAAAVLGKQGFAQLKEMFFSRFRKVTEPSAVSANRYRVGLFMFFVPLLLGWLQPYVVHFFSCNWWRRFMACYHCGFDIRLKSGCIGGRILGKDSWSFYSSHRILDQVQSRGNCQC